VADTGFDTYSQNYWADAGAVFAAPFTGNYTFYTVGDDNQYLYASSIEVGGADEALLCYNSYVGNGDYYAQASQISQQVWLTEGEELFLRYRMQNWNGGDYSSLSVKIAPVYDDNGGDELLYNDTQLPPTLLQHHSVKEVQELDLTLQLEREIQVINFTNVEAADFFFYVQNRKATSTLSLDSTDSEIATALYWAANEVRKVTTVECRRFKVWREEGFGYMALFVQFEVDSFSEMTLLQTFPTDLVGAFAEIKNTYRLQVHSRKPSDFFRVHIPLAGVGNLKADIPWDASLSTVESLLEETFDVNVEVSISGYYLSGYTWRVTFEQPLGDVPEMQMESWTVGQVNSTAEVITLRNGTEAELYFEPAPVWMFEVPLRWATGGDVRSNVEVYSTVGAGDVLKAVCAGPGEAAEVGFWGSVRGSEDQCAFDYSPASTPLVTASEIVRFVDHQTVEVKVTGRNLFIAGENGTVVARVAGQRCNISSLSDEEMLCTVSSVPYGDYAVSVDVEGFGEALVRAGAELTFRQKVYSVTPVDGSLVGGQVLHITGRGFHSDANVTMGSGRCELLNATTSHLFCTTPPLVSQSNLTAAYAALGESYGNSTNATVIRASVEEVQVDGMAFNESYVYNRSHTPLVDSVFPNELSSAITQKIEIVGSGFDVGTTVHVDNITCIVQELYTDLVTCLPL